MLKVSCSTACAAWWWGVTAGLVFPYTTVSDGLCLHSRSSTFKKYSGKLGCIHCELKCKDNNPRRLSSNLSFVMECIVGHGLPKKTMVRALQIYTGCYDFIKKLYLPKAIKLSVPCYCKLDF